MGLTNTPPDLLRGTVDLMVLRTVGQGSLHGYAIAQRLRVVSRDVLHVGESALYPALQRLLRQGWVTASWGTSENKRRARFYTITALGKKHLEKEGAAFGRMLDGMARVMRDA
jgi:PadR family transcriptional regulator, regulatory protein PadR